LGAQEERPNQDDRRRRPKRWNRPDVSLSNDPVGSARGTGVLRLHLCIGSCRKTDCAASSATIPYAKFADPRAIDRAVFFNCHLMVRTSRPMGRSCGHRAVSDRTAGRPKATRSLIQPRFCSIHHHRHLRNRTVQPPSQGRRHVGVVSVISEWFRHECAPPIRRPSGLDCLHARGPVRRRYAA